MTTGISEPSVAPAPSEPAFSIIGRVTPSPSGPVFPGAPPVRPAPFHADPMPRLRIGLLNNMPDAAFAQTERQFRRLVGGDVDLQLFALRETRRGPTAQAHVDAHYASHEALGETVLDALVITGSEPRCPNLEDEPYFAALSAVVDWAATNTVSTLFSCLAAHAAVQHLDGLRRRRLPTKLTGVFSCAVDATHPLLGGLPDAVEVPHSRWNGLSEAELADRGYLVLQRSDEIGADLFVREGQSLFVFLQGHPEYDLDSLAREYRRDMLRFLDGMSPICPSVPANYFSEDTATLLGHISAAVNGSKTLTARATIPRSESMMLRPSNWQPAAAQLFRNWLSCVAVRRSAVHWHGAQQSSR